MHHMRRFFSLFSLLTISLGSSLNANADSAGLHLSIDGPELYYARDYTVPGESTLANKLRLGKHYQRLAYVQSREYSARDQLFSFSMEWQELALIQNSETFQLQPIVEIVAGKLVGGEVLSLAAGTALRRAKAHNGPFALDIHASLTAAPAILSLGEGIYLWHFNLQGEIELPQDTQLKIGLRQIGGKTDRTPNTVIFNQGPYVGLAIKFD